MATPDERKSMQVSPSVHEAVHTLATRLGTSADGALRHLLDMSTVRVQLSEQQRTRWTAAADEAGQSLPGWISHRIEAFLQQNPDRETINQIFYRVDMLCRQAGITLRTPERPRPRFPIAPPKHERE